jgi:hypothetical protein
LDRLEALVRDTRALARAEEVPTNPGGGVREWLPVLDRFHELTLVAMGNADLAQQFGLTGRQREVAQAEGPTKWTESDEPTPEGVTYGQ